MSDDIKFCNCNACGFSQICCSSDVWAIHLSISESKKYPHSKLPNGQFVIASGSDGYCIFRDNETGKCKTYDDRPMVCRQFSCIGKEEQMKTLLERYNNMKKDLESKYSAYFSMFMFPSELEMMASSMMVKDPKTGKEKQIIPRQVFGNSEEELKEKIIDMLKRSNKKEI